MGQTPFPKNTSKQGLNKAIGHVLGEATLKNFGYILIMTEKKRITQDWVYREAQTLCQKRVALSHAVYLLNDDYTPMHFVIQVLETFFYLETVPAKQLVQMIHRTGKGLCGVFSRDVAETKVMQVNSHARLHNYPLLCQMENNALTLGD